MAQQIGLLNLTKSDNSTKSSASTSAEKKEGQSLFDSLLMKSKSDLDKTTTVQKDTTNNSSDTTTKVKSKKTQQKSEDSTLNKNDKKSVEKESATQESNTVNSEETPDEEKTVKKGSSRSSLLDRMILEANKKVSNNSESEEVETLDSSDDSLEIDNNIKNSAESNLNSNEQLSDIKDNNLDENINQDIKESGNKKETSKKIDFTKSETLLISDEVQSTSNGDNIDIKEQIVSTKKQTTIDENEEKLNSLKVPLNEENINESSNEELESFDNELLVETSTLKDSSETKISEKIDKSLVKEETANIDELTDSEESNTLSSLDDEAFVNDEQRVNINLDDISEDDNESFKKNDTSTLLNKIVDSDEDNVIVAKENSASQKSNDLVTNIFLSTQKNSILSQMIMNKSEGVKTVKEGTSLNDIKTGADILDLGLEEMSVDTQESTSSQTFFKGNSQRIDNSLSILNKLNLNNTLVKDIVEDSSSLEAQTSITSTSLSSTTSDTTSVDLNVNPNLALSIQNRIVAARQQMSAMMSDIARNMYENYKPPVTAFRINLIPAQLGHIAILMKNDKENSLSISMTMSQSSTHDAVVENQTSLRDALNRTFNINDNNQTSFNLDFNMEEGSSQGTSSQQENNEQKSRNIPKHSSDEIVESLIQNKDVAEDINYM